MKSPAAQRPSSSPLLEARGQLRGPRVVPGAGLGEGIADQRQEGGPGLAAVGGLRGPLAERGAQAQGGDLLVAAQGRPAGRVIDNAVGGAQQGGGDGGTFAELLGDQAGGGLEIGALDEGGEPSGGVGDVTVGLTRLRQTGGQGAQTQGLAGDLGEGAEEIQALDRGQDDGVTGGGGGGVALDAAHDELVQVQAALTQVGAGGGGECAGGGAPGRGAADQFDDLDQELRVAVGLLQQETLVGGVEPGEAGFDQGQQGGLPVQVQRPPSRVGGAQQAGEGAGEAEPAARRRLVQTGSLVQRPVECPVAGQEQERPALGAGAVPEVGEQAQGTLIAPVASELGVIDEEDQRNGAQAVLGPQDGGEVDEDGLDQVSGLLVLQGIDPGRGPLSAELRPLPKLPRRLREPTPTLDGECDDGTYERDDLDGLEHDRLADLLGMVHPGPIDRA